MALLPLLDGIDPMPLGAIQCRGHSELRSFGVSKRWARKIPGRKLVVPHHRV